MRYLRLVGYEDENCNLGLIVAGTRGENIFADTIGDLIAHDIVEHQNGFAAIGCPADEMEALGALWFVRGQHGTLCQKGPYANMHPPQDTLGKGDFVSLTTGWWGAEQQNWWPKIGRYNTRPHDYDEDFVDIIKIARDSVISEISDWDSTREFPTDAFFENALHLMRMGFNKARRRWGEGFKAMDTYCAIRDALEIHAKNVDFDGQRFVLGYGSGRAVCRALDSNEYD